MHCISKDTHCRRLTPDGVVAPSQNLLNFLHFQNFCQIKLFSVGLLRMLQKDDIHFTRKMLIISEYSQNPGDFNEVGRDD